VHSAFKQLRDDYIEALRPVVAETLRWWDAHCGYPHTEQRPFDAKSPFHRRWVAGPAAHPRVLGLLREYWFKVVDLNERFEQERRNGAGPTPGDEGWGRHQAPPPVHTERPIDLLVNDLSTEAPELFEVMQGVIYVPIGIHPEDGLEC
jgi:hypothetical protein